MRKALGVAVFSGMLGVTMFGLALTPVFFATIDRMSHASLFTSSRLHWIADVILAVISVRPLRRWIASKQSHGRTAVRNGAVPTASEEPVLELAHSAVAMSNGHPVVSNGHATTANGPAPTSVHTPATNGHTGETNGHAHSDKVPTSAKD
jgi:hypothetical protein